jgi:uncharacterized protein (TIGR00369 family)
MCLVDEVGGGLDGLAQLRALMVFVGTPGDHAYNPIGVVDGGYPATLLDSACGCAVHSRLTASQAYTTLELKVAYHKCDYERLGTLASRGAAAFVRLKGGNAVTPSSPRPDDGDNLHSFLVPL